MLIRNLANLITLIRVIMIFTAVGLLNQGNMLWRKWGVIILCLAFLLDGLDGYIARKTNFSNKIGSLVDTLGDRITENVITD